MIKRILYSVVNRYKSDQGLRKIANSVNWLLIENLITTGLTFATGILLTRYLGPQLLGRYSYAASFVALFLPLVSLGLENIAIRELVKKKEHKDEILGNVFILKLVGSISLFVLSIVASLLYNKSDLQLTLFIAIFALGHLFDAFTVIDYFFRSRVEFKYGAISRIAATLIYSAIKLLLIFLKGPLIGFVWITTMNLIVTALFYVISYYQKHESLINWKFSLRYTKSLLRSAWPLIVSGIAITIYMQIDQIIIRSILGDRELGFYSAAVKISQAGYFIPAMVANAVFPAIINAKRKSKSLYNKRLIMLYGSFLWMSVAVALVTSLVSKPLISFLYGAEFLPAAKALSIHIWAFVFVSLGVASGKQLITEDKTKFSLYRTVIGAVASVILNLQLIPILGIVGAAYSTVISQAFAAFISNLFFDKTRSISIKMIKSANAISLLKLIKTSK